MKCLFLIDLLNKMKILIANRHLLENILHTKDDEFKSILIVVYKN